MVDGKPHRLSYMAQVVKIVVALKDLAKKVRGVRVGVGCVAADGRVV
jgi:hypothetical protein